MLSRGEKKKFLTKRVFNNKEKNRHLDVNESQHKKSRGFFRHKR